MNAPPAVPTTRVAGRRPGARRLAIVATGIVAVSILRPWGDGGTPPRTATGRDAVPNAVAEHTGRAAQAVITPPSATPAAVGPAQSPSATAAPQPAADEIACAPAEWRLVSLDHLGRWTVRSWTPAAAVRADGPLDPAIHPIVLTSSGVLAIGACSPAVFDGTGLLVSGGPARVVRAWRIEGGRAVAVALDARRDETSTGVVTLYRPGSAAATDPWPSGEFVLEVAARGVTDPLLTGGTPGARPDPGRETAPAWFIGLIVRDSG